MSAFNFDQTKRFAESPALPKKKSSSYDANDKQAILELIDLYRPKAASSEGPGSKKALLEQVNQTSYIKLRGAAIEAQLSSVLPFSTQENSTELLRIDDPDVTRIYGQYVSDQFRDPYDFTDKVLQHESYREDGIVSACVDLFVQFIIGDHFKTTIALSEDIDNDELRQQATKAFNNSPRIRAYKKTIDKTNKKLRITENLRALLTQAAIFGRSAWLTERDPASKLPIVIKILPSMTLGRVFVHSKLWSILGVEYLDFPFPKSLLKAEDILYLPIRDYHVSPGTWHYGISLVERIVHISMLNRITNQRNLKEISYRAWAGFLLLELVGNINQDTMDAIRDQIANGAGNTIMTNQNVRVTSQKFDTDIAGMKDLRDSNNKEMIRMMQVPEILFDPTTFNRATAQEIMQAWNESVLKAYRSWLCDIIEEQWIKPMLKTLIENDTRPETESETAAKLKGDNQNVPTLQELDNQFQLKSQQEQDAKDPSKIITRATGEKPLVLGQDIQEIVDKNKNTPEINFDALINNTPRDPLTGEVDIESLPWTIKVDFDPLNFDTFDAKVTSAVNLINAGIIDQIRALKMVGFDEDIQKAAIEQAINQQEQQLRMKTMQENGNNADGQGQGQGIGTGQNVQNPQSVGNNKTTPFSNKPSQIVKGASLVSQNQELFEEVAKAQLEAVKKKIEFYKQGLAAFDEITKGA